MSKKKQPTPASVKAKVDKEIAKNVAKANKKLSHVTLPVKAAPTTGTKLAIGVSLTVGGLALLGNIISLLKRNGCVCGASCVGACSKYDTWEPVAKTVEEATNKAETKVKDTVDNAKS